ncbi:MAG: type II secretion system F family protein [Planctomycetes bacterium]|nr:type II secretion system F family protein [Planctomycetota bacterium]
MTLTGDMMIFLVMVFVAVSLLATSVIVPTFGRETKATRRLRDRIQAVADGMDNEAVSLVRENRLRRLSPFERKLETLPGMESLAHLIEQSGRSIPAYRLMSLTVLAAIGSLLTMTILTGSLIVGVLAGFVLAIAPLFKLRIERSKRLARFEEQLPEALDIISRALRAGHPFVETLKLVGDEMDDPIAKEFGMAFTDINYGASVRQGFMNLLERVPSMSLMAAITAVLIQRETGGNMAEILEKIAAVVRGRFRYQRRLRTLSAEGRLSAWILTLIPFVLSAVIMLVQPDYLPMLTKEPLGRQLIIVAFVLITLGIFWIRRIIRIEV